MKRTDRKASREAMGRNADQATSATRQPMDARQSEPSRNRQETRTPADRARPPQGSDRPG